MNWFPSEPVSAESVLQLALPLLEVFAALVAIIAIVTLAIAVLHTILAVRSTESHPRSCPFVVEKVHDDRFSVMPTAGKRRLQALHLRGWLFIR